MAEVNFMCDVIAAILVVLGGIGLTVYSLCSVKRYDERLNKRCEDRYVRPPYENTCVCCGEVIPEGTQFCRKCDRETK